MSCFYDMREDETQTSWQRAFNHDVKDEELVWHRDENDRIVKVISGVGWKFQFDNEVLLRDDYYNEFIGCKIHSKHVSDLKNDSSRDPVFPGW